MNDKENAAQKDCGKAPAGSWLQHVHEDGYLCWRNNRTLECSREIWYTPWESFSSPNHRFLVPSYFAPMTKGSEVPTGSWLQHVRANGQLCWRNNHTGECAREIQYVQGGSPSSPSQRHLIPAPFAPIFKEPPSEKKKKPKGPKQWHVSVKNKKTR